MSANLETKLNESYEQIEELNKGVITSKLTITKINDELQIYKNKNTDIENKNNDFKIRLEQYENEIFDLKIQKNIQTVLRTENIKLNERLEKELKELKLRNKYEEL